MRDCEAFWDHELRSFPCGGGCSRLWVVRTRTGEAGISSLRILLDRSWCAGNGLPANLDRPPLGALWRAAMDQDPCERRLQNGADRDAWRLLVEPVSAAGDHAGAVAALCAEGEPWTGSVTFWVRAFARKLAPLLDSLQPALACGAGLPSDPGQASLFPLEFRPASGASDVAKSGPPTVSLPQPVFVDGVPGVVGVSREMTDCCREVVSVAGSQVNVLLHGESGTGKEVLARAVHRLGPRRDRRFIGVNCAALPETLFERELFGHKAGAFTGAGKEKIGLLEAADGGTFFLDEIGDMPASLQIKLLRVMQEKRLRRIGELRSRSVDVRFVAASHKDLEAEIAAGRFRLDLYYRLKVVQITIPPLRLRPEDLTHLLAHMLVRRGRAPESVEVTETALAALQAYRWPGNVRELENEVLRWLALSPGESVMALDQLSVAVQRAAGRSVDPADLATLRPMEEATELLERFLIRKAIGASGGLKSVAAKRLGLSRQGLYKKIRRYGMRDLLQAAR
ncbi:sigma 54-interacting transcriptional regulator [bacterium]|nr:sigma 54-interacting transcriptional regulator [bacterium]